MSSVLITDSDRCDCHERGLIQAERDKRARRDTRVQKTEHVILSSNDHQLVIHIEILLLIGKAFVVGLDWLDLSAGSVDRNIARALQSKFES